ncbi:MAG: hypothetical protein V7721_10555 [Porticoccaceae bacterium]
MGTINFILVGQKGSGKTCFLTVLASHCPGMTTASSVTSNYLEPQIALLEAGKVPQSTDGPLHELTFRYINEHYKVEFSVDDYDGYLIDNLHKTTTDMEETRAEFKAKIQESEGLIFFMPYDPQFDNTALLAFEQQINTITHLVEEITEGKYAKLPIPVCICVSKWDRAPSFQLGSDASAVADYISGNPYYQRVYTKLSKIFEHVEIFPLSSFGPTNDGLHPTKGNVTPYQLDKPFEHLLEKLFQRYDQKITEHKSNDDPFLLFDYLYELYEDLKLYRGGEYCALYDDMESDYTHKIIQDIQSDKQTACTKEQRRIYGCIRQEELHQKIDRALNFNKKTRNKRRFFVAAGVVLCLIITTLGAGYLDQKIKQEEQIAYIKKVASDEGRPVTEVISRAARFYQSWKYLDNIPFRNNLYNNREDLLNTTNNTIRKRTEALTIKARGSEVFDLKVIQRMATIRETIKLWPDAAFRQTIQMELQPFFDSHEVLKSLRLLRDQATTATLKEFVLVKDKANDMSITWLEVPLLLEQIYETIVTVSLDRAENSLLIDSVSTLEKSTDELTNLKNIGDTRVIDILDERITPALEIAFRKQQFSMLLSEITQQSDISGMDYSIKDKWLPSYTEPERMELLLLLQQKYSDFERREVPPLKKLGSRNDMKGITDKLRNITHKTGVLVIDSQSDHKLVFRYQRPDDVKESVAAWRTKLGIYETTLSGVVTGYIKFTHKKCVLGDCNNPNPLQFVCETLGGLIGEEEIQLSFKDEKSSPDNEQVLPDDEAIRGICLHTNDIDAEVKWDSKIALRMGRHKIEAVMDGNDERWSSTFDLEEADIFEYINKETLTIEITPYQIEISTL